MDLFKEAVNTALGRWLRFGKRYIVLYTIAILLVAYVALAPFIKPNDLIKNRFFLGFAAIVLLAGPMLFLWATTRPLPKGRFNIVIAHFRGIPSDQQPQADAISHAVADKLRDTMEAQGVRGHLREVNYPIDEDSAEKRERCAWELGRHYASHIVIYGDVRIRPGEFLFRPIIVNRAAVQYRYSPGKQLASPAALVGSGPPIEFQLQKESETASLALFMCGMIRLHWGAYDEAIRILDSMPVPNHRSLFYRGYAQYQLGQYEAALASFDLALSLKENFARAWFFKSATGYQLGRMGVFEAALKRAHEANAEAPPEEADSDLHVALEAVRFSGIYVNDVLDKWTTDVREAADRARSFGQEILEQVAEHRKGLADSESLHHWFVGNRAFRAKQYDDAIKAYETALTTRPAFVNARIGKALALACCNRIEEARAEISLVEPHAIEDEYQCIAAARVYSRVGDASAAVSALQQALSVASKQHNVTGYSEFDVLANDPAFVAVAEQLKTPRQGV